jgi:hypothetical protein
MRYEEYVAWTRKGVVLSLCSGNPNRKTQFGRPKHRSVDNIKIDLQETGRSTWIGLTWLGGRNMWQASANMVNLWV